MDIDTERRLTVDRLPDGVLRQVFSHLSAEDLETMRQVSVRWNAIAAHHSLWREHCFDHSPSLRTERSAWPLLACFEPVSPVPWRSVFRTLQNRPRGVVTIHKSGRFICNVIAHLIKGPYAEVPQVVVVRRRFDITFLPRFLSTGCTYFYMEPLCEEDKHPYEQFVQYLVQRDRAGLVLLPRKRLMLIPPCTDVRQRVNYCGERLIGAVQGMCA